jgi:hypothetical protein
MSDTGTSHSSASDTMTWLTNFLANYAGQDFSANDEAVLRQRLRTLTLLEVASAIELANLAPGAGATIVLYQYWIASQPTESPLLFIAWFNLGVAFIQTSDRKTPFLPTNVRLHCGPTFIRRQLIWLSHLNRLAGCRTQNRHCDAVC